MGNAYISFLRTKLKNLDKVECPKSNQTHKPIVYSAVLWIITMQCKCCSFLSFSFFGDCLSLSFDMSIPNNKFSMGIVKTSSHKFNLN